MVKLKKYKLKKFVCPTCKGNGFVRITNFEADEMIHQCWDCESEGEFYVHESEISEYDDVDNNDRNTDKLLH